MKVCSIDGCAKTSNLSICPMHRTRMRRYGDYNARGRWLKGDPKEVFWSHVEKSDYCWEWQAYAAPTGYGQFTYKGKPIGAHRASWQINVGPIPDGLHVLHHCDNRICVRPSHLFLGTNAENIRDRNAKKRANFHSKLSEADVADIRRLLATGLSQRKVAARFHVSQAPVNYILRGKSWVGR